jgi:hypothetical protein
MEEDRIWHIDNALSKLPPRDALGRILDDDLATYKKAQADLREEIQLLDDGIALYVELIQVAYNRLDEWKSKPSLKASIGMAVTALNYILLARHSILMGYYPEARGLLRSCHEAITRCYLFFVDDEEAKYFLSGEQIGQAHVDTKLAAIFAVEDGDKIRSELRKYYGDQSKVVHPNIESLQARILEPTFGIPHVIGGFLSVGLGRAVIAVLIKSVVTALHILSAVVSEQTGRWAEDYEKVKAGLSQLLSKLQSESQAGRSLTE